MHAWLCENPIGADALQWKELPTPQPKAGEVLIQIAAASVNYPDVLRIQKKYQVQPELPFIPGSEVAGTVAALGEGVTNVKLGDRVIAFVGLGGFAEQVVASSSSGGIGISPAALASTCSAKPPRPTNAITRSPSLTLVTPSPSAATVPATSLPGMKGSSGCTWYFFWIISTSG